MTPPRSPPVRSGIFESGEGSPTSAFEIGLGSLRGRRLASLAKGRQARREDRRIDLTAGQEVNHRFELGAHRMAQSLGRSLRQTTQAAAHSFTRESKPVGTRGLGPADAPGSSLALFQDTPGLLPNRGLVLGRSDCAFQFGLGEQVIKAPELFAIERLRRVKSGAIRDADESRAWPGTPPKPVRVGPARARSASSPRNSIRTRTRCPSESVPPAVHRATAERSTPTRSARSCWVQPCSTNRRSIQSPIDLEQIRAGTFAESLGRPARRIASSRSIGELARNSPTTSAR